jgi:heme/copper-type cytochrome/quinol oxidase subunit 2
MACFGKREPNEIEKAGYAGTDPSSTHYAEQTKMTQWLLAMIVGSSLALPALAQDKAAPAPRERTIYVAAVESKGGVHVDHEPFPTQAVPEGGGYLLKKPDDKGRWEVSSYRWDPGTIVVNQGDQVTLEIVGINGNEHPFTIEGYWLTGTVRRGQITRLTFIADKAGIFKIICRTHSPSMQADLVVLANK